MNEPIENIVEKICALPDDWHGGGTLTSPVLRAIAKHAAAIGEIFATVETGSGKSTLLFSHISPQHTVFSIDETESISQVKASPLFRSENVTYVEGPTQLTMPKHRFDRKLQIALIDGPHAYPFPDLEYYYLYPAIEEGGLLLIDDIKIPSIERMFAIISAEEMFEVVEVVAYTAFLRRTSAPLIDPVGDSWWLQPYNKRFYQQWLMETGQPEKYRLQPLAAKLPAWLKSAIPPNLKYWWKTRQ